MLRKIRILFILPKTQQGGAETQMLYLLRDLNRDKFKVYLGLLYESKQIKDKFESIKDLDIIHFDKKNKFDISIYFKIAKFIRNNKIDIIQTFLGNHHSYIPAIIALKSLSIGGIRGTHDKDFSIMDRIKEFTIPKILTKLRRFILISNSYEAKEIYLKKGFRFNAIHVIPNGIDYLNFSNGNKDKVINEFNLKHKLVLGTVSRLVNGKNHEKLIIVFKELTKEYNNLILFIIGDGPLMNNLQQLTKKLSLTSKIIFTGNRKDIPNVLLAMDIFLFPSYYKEGWPNVVGEAMVAGLPVVSFDVGDVKHIIKDNTDGFIVGNDINKLVQRTKELIKNPELRVIIGERARDKIKNNYSIKALINSYEKLYYKVKGK